MTGIRILGAHGSVSDQSHTTCIQVTKHTLIDAGNILHALGEKAQFINNIFLSHAHLDHIIDSAFLMDNFFATRDTPLNIYGLPETIHMIQTHIFNNAIWPDFSSFFLPNSSTKSVNFIEIEPNKEYHIEDNISLTPILSNHTVPCCGYIITKEENAIYFSGDTYKNENIWKIIDKNKKIKSLIIDVSFPSALQKIAKESRHLTPQDLYEEHNTLKRRDCKIYINHLKPPYKEKIIEELVALGYKQESILDDGAIITFEEQKVCYQNESIENKIKKLNNIGISLSAEENLDTLLELIVKEAKSLTNADGGTLYLLNNDSLKFTVVQTDSLHIQMGGTSGAITWPSLPLYLENKEPNTKMVAVMCALEGKTINIPDVYEANGFSFDGTKKFDASTSYRSKSMLVIPLRDHEQKIIGVLQLLNKQNFLENTIDVFNQEDEDITLSLASQAAIAITNVGLIQGLEELLEAFLKSIIFAISKKSPYTASHIRRMVHLSVSLAKAVDKDTTVYKEKSFSKEELKQMNFAALMHDIGKLATPEHILDKRTKLETIFDRVEIILARIQLIQKEFEISLLKDEITQEEFEKESKKLNEYSKIIQKSNEGSEFFSDEEVKLIQDIEKQTYTFSSQQYKILTPDEAYNLCVQKGTLTKEQREIINKHAKISVDILEKLPFPEKYKEVPQISGNHHEKLNGKGYPKGLKEENITFEARILAIADIFEALTASDRPYKKANSLSFAMKILYFMAKDGELDKNLVKFFYDSKLYLEYAKKFLPKSSIDEVSVSFEDL